MVSALHEFQGGCHCGALGFSFHTASPVAEWHVRACQCRFCRAHGVLSTSDPNGRLAFQVGTGESLERYRFGLKTADFLLCRSCGVYIGAQIRAPRGAFGIINVLALRPIPDLPGPVAADYDSESLVERIARRERRWTPLEMVVR